MQLNAVEIMTRPAIAIEERHYARLFALASNAHEPTGVCEYLREELERARIISPTAWDPAIASLGSKVEFRDEHTGKVQEIVLVYPAEADIARGQISVLTRIGTSLIGLSANQTISFRNRFGVRRTLTVLRVTSPE